MKIAVVCANGKALDELRERSDVRWTFVSPAADFQTEGEHVSVVRA